MQELINAVTSEQIRKCSRVGNWLTGNFYYEINIDQNTRYIVASTEDFDFTCTCGQDDCEHPLWCIATAREIKRIAKLNPQEIKITKVTALQFTRLIYVNDGYTVHHSSGEYRCSCPVARSNRLNLIDADCAHEVAVKKIEKQK